MRLTLTITFLALISLLSSAQDSLWVHVNIPVACIRDGKSHASEMTSQAIMGTPMLVLEDDGGEWLRLQGPDGYEGYMNVSSVARFVTSRHARMAQVAKSHRDIVLKRAWCMPIQPTSVRVSPCRSSSMAQYSPATYRMESSRKSRSPTDVTAGYCHQP